MEIYLILAYTSLIMFAATLILWYLSGKLLKRNKAKLSRTFVYIGGFLFSFSIVFGLIALVIFNSK